MTQTERNIRTEIRRAMKRLGGPVPSTQGWGPAKFYYALERRGAPHRLLGVVGSWQDTMEDVDVLDALREWNRTGDIEFDVLLASTSTD